MARRKSDYRNLESKDGGRKSDVRKYANDVSFSRTSVRALIAKFGIFGTL
ncbi:MAG: hypothetical protein KG029_12455 [Bacteroidetes bacterium]|nr:hypothetical protein [Bacteroidota bacterium]